MTRRLIIMAVSAFSLAVVLYIFYHGWQHWIAKETGSENIPGAAPNYGYWSGFGSVFPWSMTVVISLLAILYHNFRKHNCEVTGCWRIGRHDTAAGHTVCRKHHPDDKLTAEDVMTAHRVKTTGREMNR